MNAASQRQLTPWLIGVLAGSGALLLAVSLGLGSGVRWDAPRPLAALPPAHVGATLPPSRPLTAFAPVWQKPLFSADRLPTATAATAAVSLGELELTGIILSPGLHLALLHDKSGDRPVRVAEGATLPDSGWRLVELKARSAVFASASGRTELTLPVTAPAALTPPTRATGGAHSPAQSNASAAAPAPSSTAPIMQVVPATASAPPSSPTDEAAQQRARLEALKAAVQRRRAQSQVPSAPDLSSRDH
jgi:general secretion pathway protein N